MQVRKMSYISPYTQKNSYWFQGNNKQLSRKIVTYILSLGNLEMGILRDQKIEN
jgi:hypothetical protein